MLNFAARLRLRHVGESALRHFNTATDLAIQNRFADKAHRSLLRKLETESRKYRKDKAARIKIRPSIPDLFVWLQKSDFGNNDSVTVSLSHPPKPRDNYVLETTVFHLLRVLLAKNSRILNGETERIIQSLEKLHKADSNADCDLLLRVLDYGHSLDSTQKELINACLTCIEAALKNTSSISDISKWIGALTASTVTDSWYHISTLASIPPFLAADLLTRTPMSTTELGIQLSVWHKNMSCIAIAYYTKPSYVSGIIRSLATYTVHFDARLLPAFMEDSIVYLSSRKSGFVFKIFTPAFTNELIYTLAFTHLESNSRVSSASIVRAQEHLVKHIGHMALNEQGYMGVVLAIEPISHTKASRLMETSRLNFDQPQIYSDVARIVISQTPEQLLHALNAALERHPNSSAVWLAFVKNLSRMGLLTEKRAPQIFKELCGRELILSKELVRLILHAVRSIPVMEKICELLEKADLLKYFKRVLHDRFMAILYRMDAEIKLNTPYLARAVGHCTALEGARRLYRGISRTTVSEVGTMLLGESQYQVGEVYNLYKAELNERMPDEHCLIALLRTSATLKNLKWGDLLASQVSVQEFQRVVSRTKNGFQASDRLWRAYIDVLAQADYLPELAEIIRWWVEVGFVPSRPTLQALLLAMPEEFARRHVKHVAAIPANSSTLLAWPWPSPQEML